MSRTPSRCSWNRAALHTLCGAGIALLAAAPPARAGIGDMMKKAQDKVTKSAQKKAEDEKPCPPVEFDEITVELTNDRIKGILATFQAAGTAGVGRPELVDKLNKLTEDRNKIDEKHGEAVRETQRKRSDIESCYHEGYQEAQERKAKEYSERVLTDPALTAKYSKLAQENNAAMKGDSAAMNRIMQGMYEEITPSKEDSAAARKNCGPLPPKSGPEQQMDAFDRQIRAVNDSIAVIDERVWKAQAKKGGLTEDQWFAALERLRSYVGFKQSHASKTPGCGFTKAEIEAIEANLPQITAILG